MSILITGSEGFVGRYVACEAARRSLHCVAFDRVRPVRSARPFESGRATPSEAPDEPSAGGVFAQVDILDGDALRRCMRQAIDEVGPPDYVFHMAAQASVADSFAAPAQTYAVNVVGTAVLLEVLAAVAPGSRVLVPSSAHVYGSSHDAGGILTETSAIHPSTHYGASKAAQEAVGRLFREHRGLPVFITRSFNHCGPGQGPGFVFSDFARKLALLERQGGGILSVGNLDVARDFLDVRDVVAAYFTVLEKGEPSVPYIVASGIPARIGDILDMFRAEISVDVEVRPDRDLMRPIDAPVLLGDASRLRALGWAPAFDLRGTIRETLGYWRERVYREGEHSI